MTQPDDARLDPDGAETPPIEPQDDTTAETTEVVVVRERHLATLPRAGKPALTRRAGLPAPVKKAAAAIAVGAALQVGVTLATKYLAAQAGKKAVEGAATRGLKAAASRSGKQPASRRADDGADDVAELVSETLVVRRVWMKRSRD